MKNSIIIILLLITTTLFSQKKENFIIPDSLKKMSFEDLEKRFDNSLFNKKILAIYAKTYYKKSKLQNDEILIANGMYMAAYVAVNDVISLQYADSIIALTKKGNDLKYPAKGYIFKSNIFFTKDQLDNALYNILEAKKYSNKAGNAEQKILIKQQIGLIKIELGKPKEALPLILENYDYFKLKHINSPEFIYSAWILSDIYNRLEKPNISLFYINIILRDIKKDNRYYKYFLMNKGVSYHLKKHYPKSNELLDQSILLLKNDKLNLAISYYYRGENVLQGEKNILKSKQYFEKVDSILITTDEFTTLLRNNYINLIQITKKLKEDKQQLYYLNRLIEIDKRLNNNNIVLSENINHNYDTPLLLSEKEKVIVKINQEKYIYIIIGFIVFAGLVFSLYCLVKTKREKQLYEKRFRELMEQPINEVIPDNIIAEENKTKLFVDLPIVIVKELLIKLAIFEEEHGYLELNLKLNDLSKRLNTNSSYLSKTINHYKGKNFTQYLNDLRITYIINKLKVDKKIRKYTIKAIAEEVGFSNSESFAKAFFNKTGLQPSYFIKKIEDNNEI
ncbi:AraC-type DNA-binding protein [Flavobacterium omnivorum]|uniref:AraC-type DNA-binding protein n=1 Tax=Flavobacterium omnivorum TaxID=178355 RepID=A0A1G7WUU3_9FLAO|nr:AraC family transcriptional regulator [Flavobacterium omnivorum]SDG75689.1 AraC-type DNA-binding protein [Flavobacterium omnivorum]